MQYENTRNYTRPRNMKTTTINLVIYALKLAFNKKKMLLSWKKINGRLFLS